MKRNLLKDGFRVEDFAELMGPGQGGPRIDVYAHLRPEVALLIAQQANALLRPHLGEPEKVNGFLPGGKFVPLCMHSVIYEHGVTHTAYLVCREKLGSEEGK